MGKLIVIEGACDGIGKTTQFELLYNNLIKSGERVICHHFPSYNEYQGKAVEKYLNGEFGLPKNLSHYFVHNLYATDRAITWYSKLKKEYDLGATILLDRYNTSSVIYQSALIQDVNERKKFIDFIIDYEYNKIGIQIPDKVIFLHASFDLVTKLRDEREINEGIKNDIHERDLEFMKKVYDSAMFAADYLKWSKVQCDCGNKMKTIDEIHSMICEEIK